MINRSLCWFIGYMVLTWSLICYAAPDSFSIDKFKMVDAYPTIYIGAQNDQHPQGILFRGSVPVDKTYTRFTLPELLQYMNDSYRAVSSKNLPFGTRNIRIVDVAVFDRLEARNDLPDNFFTLTLYNALTGSNINSKYMDDHPEFPVEGKIYPTTPYPVTTMVNGKPVTVNTQFIWWQARNTSDLAKAMKNKNSFYTGTDISLIDVMQKLMGQVTPYNNSSKVPGQDQNDLVLVYVHCQHGSDRTGAVIGSYLLQNNLDVTLPKTGTPFKSLLDYAWYGSQIFKGKSASSWSLSNNENYIFDYCSTWLQKRKPSLVCNPDFIRISRESISALSNVGTIAFSGLSPTGFTLVKGPDYGNGRPLYTEISNQNIDNNAALPFSFGEYRLFSSETGGSFIEPIQKTVNTVEISTSVPNAVVNYAASFPFTINYSMSNIKPYLSNQLIANGQKLNSKYYTGTQTLKVTQNSNVSSCTLTFGSQKITLGSNPLCKVITIVSNSNITSIRLPDTIPNDGPPTTVGYTIQVHYDPPIQPMKVYLDTLLITRDGEINSTKLQPNTVLKAQQGNTELQCSLVIGKSTVTLGNDSLCTLMRATEGSSGKIILTLPNVLDDNPIDPALEAHFIMPPDEKARVLNQWITDGSMLPLSEFDKIPQDLTAYQGDRSASCLIQRAGDTLNIVPNSGSLIQAGLFISKVNSGNTELVFPSSLPALSFKEVSLGIPNNYQVIINAKTYIASSSNKRVQLSIGTNLIKTINSKGVMSQCNVQVSTQGISVTGSSDRNSGCFGITPKGDTIYFPAF